MIGGLRVIMPCEWCDSRDPVWMKECGHYLCDFCGGDEVCPLCKDKERVEALDMEYAA